jgi:CheY-like chemotaxis protein
MSYKYPQSINKYLHEHSSLVVLDMDGHGVIREANRFAQSLAGKELRGLPMQEFFVDFITLPDVNTILKEGVHKQMLNVKTFHGLPQTMYFSSLSTTDGFMLIGEIDHIEVEELRNSMITLNNELNNLARELQKKNIELDQVRRLKILIAEDDEVSEKLFDRTVKMFGKEILNVRTGVEAVKACLQNPDIDLVLMDIRMPEMNGYEATRQIREFNKDVVILAQTAYGLFGDREKAIEAGCNDYIAKPIKKEELLALIQKHTNLPYL